MSSSQPLDLTFTVCSSLKFQSDGRGGCSGRGRLAWRLSMIYLEGMLTYRCETAELLASVICIVVQYECKLKPWRGRELQLFQDWNNFVGRG